MIRSNIKSVIARLQRFQAGLPGAVGRVLVPEKHLTHLEVVASRTLKLLAETPEERELVPFFVATIRSELLSPNGFRFLMSAPQRGRLGSVSAAQTAFEGSRTREYADGRLGERRVPLALEPDVQVNIENAREAVSQWVKFEKIFDERDAGYSHEQVTDRLLWIMGLNVAQRFGDSFRTPAMRAAATGLARRVQSFWESAAGGGAVTAGLNAPKWGDVDRPGKRLIGGEPLLSEAKVREWLAAVLAAWKSALRDRIRLGLRREIAELKQRVRTDLL